MKNISLPFPCHNMPFVTNTSLFNRSRGKEMQDDKNGTARRASLVTVANTRKVGMCTKQYINISKFLEMDR